MRLGVLLAGAAAAVALAGPARAAGVEACLWSTLPAEQRERMLDDYRRDGFMEFDSSALDNLDRDAWRDRCGVTSQHQEQASLLFVAYYLELGVAGRLGDAHGITGHQLDQAWEGVDGGEKAAFIDLVRKKLSGQTLPDVDGLAPIRAMRAWLRLPEEEAVETELFAYAYARGLRAVAADLGPEPLGPLTDA